MYDMLPWWWRAAYWAITMALLTPAVIYTLLAFVNPFWFRDRMLQSAVDFISTLERKRSTLMRPALRKYCLLESLRRGHDIL